MKKQLIKPLPNGNELKKLAPIYLARWKNLQDYPEQEKALVMLFEEWNENKDLQKVMIKVATLDNFYSTQLKSVPEVANRILSISNFDTKVEDGDVDLVDLICTMGEYNPFSFATKYCSFHNPDAYPIYDSFVARVLTEYRTRDKFTNIETKLSSSNKEKSYKDEFYPLITNFRDYYGLTKYSFKELDRFLWSLGKEYFGGNSEPLMYKSAKIGDYTINIEMFGSVLVYKKSELFSNTLEGLREAAKLLNGFNFNPKWITRQAGREVVKYAVEHPECMP